MCVQKWRRVTMYSSPAKEGSALSKSPEEELELVQTAEAKMEGRRLNDSSFRVSRGLVYYCPVPAYPDLVTLQYLQCLCRASAILATARTL